MNHSGWNVNKTPFFHFMRLPVKSHGSLTFQHVIELSGTLVKMGAGTINVHRVSPGSGRKNRIFPTNQPVSPTAGATLSGCHAFVPDES